MNNGSVGGGEIMSKIDILRTGGNRSSGFRKNTRIRKPDPLKENIFSGVNVAEF